jgi:hypothetical protein
MCLKDGAPVSTSRIRDLTLSVFNSHGGPRDICRDLESIFPGLGVTTLTIRSAYRTEMDSKYSRDHLAWLDQADGHSAITVARHYIKNQNSVHERRRLTRRADELFERAFPRTAVDLQTFSDGLIGPLLPPPPGLESME